MKIQWQLYTVHRSDASVLRSDNIIILKLTLNYQKTKLNLRQSPIPIVSSWPVSCLISCKIDGCTAQQMSFVYLFIYFVSKIQWYGGFFLCRESSVTLSERSRRHAVETDEREFMWLYPGVTVNRRAINTHRRALCLCLCPCGSPTDHMKNSSLNTSSPSYKYTSPQCECVCVGGCDFFLEWTRMPTQ